MNGKEKQEPSFWKSLSAVDWAALALFVFGVLAWWAETRLAALPGLGLARLIGLLAGLYLLYRFWTRWRNGLLWSLRNRLIVAYLFIAVVPIILILALGGIAAQTVYSQLGAYLLYHDLHDRIAMLEDCAAHIAKAESTLPISISQEVLENSLAAQANEAEGKDLPGLKVDFHASPKLLRRLAGPQAQSFSGLVQEGNQLRLMAVREVVSPRGTSIIDLTVPVTAEFLEGVATDLGPIDVTLSQRVQEDSARSAVQIGSKYYRAVGSLKTEKRVLPVPNSWADPVYDGFSKLEATYLGAGESVEAQHPVFAFFKARRSQLNRRIFAAVGEFSSAKGYGVMLLFSVAFLLIEIAALVIGVVLTRAITRTISDLSRATQAVQEGNFSARVPVERRDQLGMLGESFNSMTSSIGRLISEQKQLQRLEHEISIAREVQNQLFPRHFPYVEGVEIEAICRAARSVSGDYYDFIQLTPTHVAIAIADISGKGISAALLMASLQAALRSQLLTPGSEHLSTAELVSRLNKHLLRHTGDDRFATFFVAVYDMSTRLLRYTNAGHLPGFCLSEGKAIHLVEGGIVLGVLEEYQFEEGRVSVPTDAVVICYSDGLIEPENDYGEQFGMSRLEAAAQRVRQGTPRKIAEALMTAAEEWSGTPEQADDMTVVVAKLR
ncbi:MAG TPA: PP2C family protein-serine/threonine phosphatase [Candidatus Limnocylindrales bacterium]|nr:PP2C family protein-serine/threonine phosphatase [Candidatus Limnocylindrales bacterium]